MEETRTKRAFFLPPAPIRGLVSGELLPSSAPPPRRASSSGGSTSGGSILKRLSGSSAGIIPGSRPALDEFCSWLLLRCFITSSVASSPEDRVTLLSPPSNSSSSSFMSKSWAAILFFGSGRHRAWWSSSGSQACTRLTGSGIPLSLYRPRPRRKTALSGTMSASSWSHRPISSQALSCRFPIRFPLSFFRGLTVGLPPLEPCWLSPPSSPVLLLCWELLPSALELKLAFSASGARVKVLHLRAPKNVYDRTDCDPPVSVADRTLEVMEGDFLNSPPPSAVPESAGADLLLMDLEAKELILLISPVRGGCVGMVGNSGPKISCRHSPSTSTCPLAALAIHLAARLGTDPK
mmetsp:Transcript_7066/g.19956  ORF Transcript_7066/g.19956 Transcript_7066/m.19956 type:complete len:350 (-) Transcript_7066:3523-4572(-)